MMYPAAAMQSEEKHNNTSSGVVSLSGKLYTCPVAEGTTTKKWNSNWVMAINKRFGQRITFKNAENPFILAQISGNEDCRFG